MILCSISRNWVDQYVHFGRSILGTHTGYCSCWMPLLVKRPYRHLVRLWQKCYHSWKGALVLCWPLIVIFQAVLLKPRWSNCSKAWCMVGNRQCYPVPGASVRRCSRHLKCSPVTWPHPSSSIEPQTHLYEMLKGGAWPQPHRTNRCVADRCTPHHPDHHPPAQLCFPQQNSLVVSFIQLTYLQMTPWVFLPDMRSATWLQGDSFHLLDRLLTIIAAKPWHLICLLKHVWVLTRHMQRD